MPGRDGDASTARPVARFFGRGNPLPRGRDACGDIFCECHQVHVIASSLRTRIRRKPPRKFCLSALIGVDCQSARANPCPPPLFSSQGLCKTMREICGDSEQHCIAALGGLTLVDERPTGSKNRSAKVATCSLVRCVRHKPFRRCLKRSREQTPNRTLPGCFEPVT